MAMHLPDWWGSNTKEIEGQKYLVLQKNNARRDSLRSDNDETTHGATWLEPVLPGRFYEWEFNLPNNFVADTDEYILWEISADNAIKNEQRISVQDIRCEHNNLKLSNLRRFITSGLRQQPFIMIALVIVLIILAILAVVSIF